MEKSDLTEIEKIMYSDLEPFFIAIVKELGRHAKKKHLTYRHGSWNGDFAENVIYQILEEKPISELLKNPDDALDRAAFLGWFWLHTNDLMPEYEMSPEQRAWYSLATQGKR